MKHLFTVAAIALMLTASTAFAQMDSVESAPYFASYDKALEAAGDGQHIVLDFYTDW